MNNHSILYGMWRILFFPIAPLALFVAAGIKGALAIICFGFIVFALRYI